MAEKNLFRICAEIDLDAVRDNILALKDNLLAGEGHKVCAVIKADAYGHGAVQVGEYIKDIVDFFAVATMDEAMELREAGLDLPILILGYVHPEYAAIAAENDIRLTVFDVETAEQLSRNLKDAGIQEDKKLKIHIAIDTGMNRIGFQMSLEMLNKIKEISQISNLEIEGIFTHFFAADSENLSSAERQFAFFTDVISELEKEGVRIPIHHCANSAASTRMQHTAMDMARFGISIYGLYPSDCATQVTLKPVMTLKSHVVMVKTIHAGATVGYGATYTAPHNTVVATIPVGYADGYMRSLSNKGYVLIRGQKAPIIGRICMDQFMVDVSSIEGVCRGDEVVLAGKQEDSIITMEEISELAGSFNYEFACDINKRVPRVYIKNRH